MKRVLLAIAFVTLVSSLSFGQHSVTLSWTQSTSTGITGNNVYRSTTSGSGYQQIFASTTPITTYTDNNVTALTTYYYVVTAVCSTCSPSESTNSNQAQAAVPGSPQPNAPTNLTAPTVK